MNLLWWSVAPWCPTGYGGQAKLVLKRLEALGHRLAVCAHRGLGDTITTFEQTIPILPKGRQLFSADVVGEYAKRFNADAVISLLDVWPLNTSQLSALPRWCPIVPIDTDVLPDFLVRRLSEHTHMPIAMSRHGEAAMLDAGVDCRYIPHAYDKSVFYPMPKDEAREILKWPKDAFVATIVAANYVGIGHPNRKCFGESFQAFAELKKKHSDVMLYCHSEMAPMDQLGGGSDLMPLIDRLNLGKHVYFPDPMALQLGMPGSYLRAVYSGSDVLLAASAGEGFGVPIIEAQACGLPVIVGDWSAMSELCGAGWKVQKSEAHPLWTQFGAYWHLPHPMALARYLETAYYESKQLGQRALSFALPYEIENVVANFWKPFLDGLQGSVCEAPDIAQPAPQHVSPLSQ